MSIRCPETESENDAAEDERGNPTRASTGRTHQDDHRDCDPHPENLSDSLTRNERERVECAESARPLELRPEQEHDRDAGRPGKRRALRAPAFIAACEEEQRYRRNEEDCPTHGDLAEV